MYHLIKALVSVRDEPLVRRDTPNECDAFPAVEFGSFDTMRKRRIDACRDGFWGETRPESPEVRARVFGGIS